MSPVLLLLLLFPLTLSATLHVITFHPPTPPSTLLYDPTSQHFLLSSTTTPTISTLSDAGVIQPLVHDSALPSLPLLSLDPIRRRVLSLPSPSLLASFHLLSRSRLFLSPLPLPASSLALDPISGKTFLTTPSSLLISDSEGNISVIGSELRLLSNVTSLAFNPKGFLLGVGNGDLVRIDCEDGSARKVVVRGRGGSVFENVTQVAVRSDGVVVVAGGESVWVLRSEDGWVEAGVYDEIKIGEGRTVRGVAVRDGRRVFVMSERRGGDWRVEEVESERETGGEWVGLMVMGCVGFGVFLFWRFQMRRLVGDMNKKIA